MKRSNFFRGRNGGAVLGPHMSGGSAGNSLMEGVLPSMLWQIDRS